MAHYLPYPTWTVLPHGPLEAIDSNVWRIEGTLEGMPVRRVMTIARRSDGQLVLHSPIAVSDVVRKEIEALGPVGLIAVPSGYHRLDVHGYRDRYPNAELLCPRGARARVEKVARLDGGYDEYPGDADVALFTVAGTGEQEGGMLVHGSGGATLVLNDLVFNMPHVPGLQGFILKHVTRSSGGPRISRLARFALIKDKRACRAELERLAATPGLARVIVSHHEPIEDEPGRVLRDVAASLTT